MGGVKENAEGPEGVSEGGLEANEKLEAPETNAEDPPRVKAEGMAVEDVVDVGKIDEADDIIAAGMPVIGPMLKRDEEEGGTVGATAEATPMFGNELGAEVAEDELLGGFAAKEPTEQGSDEHSVDHDKCSLQ